MARHPQLAEKLDLLYLLQLNPKIANDSALARELSVARQTISRWRVGTSTSRGNSIPIRQIRRIDKARMYLNKARGLEKMRSFRFRDAEIESLERVLG